MAFRVEVAPRAIRDLDETVEYILESGSPASAERWFRGIMNEIRLLAEMPARCPIAEESESPGLEIRVLVHGRRNRGYKVYFAIDVARRVVQVLHVRHWARRPPSASELSESPRIEE